MPDRELLAPAYPDDTGAADPALAAALAAYAADPTDPAGLPAALAALQTVRVLVPVVAVAGEPVGKTVDPVGVQLDDLVPRGHVLVRGRLHRDLLVALSRSSAEQCLVLPHRRDTY